MKTLDVLRDNFLPRLQSAGQKLFEQGTVVLADMRPDRIDATVRSEGVQVVQVEWDKDGARFKCTCGDFHQSDSCCKHVWATLLASDAQGKLPRDLPDRFGPDWGLEPAVDTDNEDDNEPLPGHWSDTEAGSDEVDDDYEEEEESDLGDVFDLRSLLSLTANRRLKSKAEPQRHAIWRRRLTELRTALQWDRAEPPVWANDREVVYIINAPKTLEGEGLCIELYSRRKKKSGIGYERRKRLRLNAEEIATLPDAVDRQLLRSLAGLRKSSFYYGGRDVEFENRIMDRGVAELVRQMCQTSRCRLQVRADEEEPITLRWDDAGPWEFHVVIVEDESGKGYRLTGRLQRGEARRELSQTKLMYAGGPVFIDDTAAALDDFGAFPFVKLLSQEPGLLVPSEQIDDLLKELTQFPKLPKLELPEPLKIAVVHSAPKFRLKIGPPSKQKTAQPRDGLAADVLIEYGDHAIAETESNPAVFDAKNRQIVYRDRVAEKHAIERLREVGLRKQHDFHSGRQRWWLPANKLPGVVRALTAEQWQVEVDGRSYRKPGQISIEVSSGIDWFELNGKADFEGIQVSLPALLRAVKKGEHTIVLDDGSIGILPEEWLKRYRLLAAVGDVQKETVQFARAQVGLLDALLAEMPMVNFDASFNQAREHLLRFQGVHPLDPPVTFQGSLRPYQREGLGWMSFLRGFGFQGCLADDMGLGKTVQVLALLEERRLQRQEAAKPSENGSKIPPPPIGPSLVVVPRSLVFNWRQEAARFAPQLRVLDHASADRLRTVDHFADHDVILTTYGTLRNDIVAMKDIRFDYAILDEAQAIKNPASESAKAARLIRSDYRMALSGTPVQNHLGELWSLFEFLNPGMLGASRTFGTATASKTIDPHTRQILSQALRPLILRRTKEQVARDLPEKFEQTIFCELDKTQRALYNELKEHYRQSLLGAIQQNGMAKSKLQILEALLRLRQAACHPGLLDKSRLDQGSAKMDTLLPRLEEVAEEGHKAIVFSQFTSFLAIVRKKLDEQGVVYEYLDGKTRDRQQHVDRFQTDDKCKLFLISLKAGGLGLNLTAAQYVFLLDPWWNPAIEAQAIDRAHRIGQTRNVFAYRLIAKDTVEEKVLQLQQGKRELADAIINADNALISNMGKEELDLLLS